MAGHERRARLKDARRKDWFSVDDEVVLDYGLDHYGIAVYAVLAMHSDAEGRSEVGLRYLCRTLKVGREKLLKVIAQLEDAGLLAVETGDRILTNEYTLLEVRKRPRERPTRAPADPAQGGSQQNHGGSEENRGGPDENRGGGSDENRGGSDQNQNHRVALPARPAARAPAREDTDPEDGSYRRSHGAEPYASVHEARDLLLGVPGLGMKPGEVASVVVRLWKLYPEADPVRVAREYEYNHLHGGETTQRHAAKLRRYFEASHNRRQRGRKEGPVAAPVIGQAPERPGRRPAGDKRRPEGSVRDGYEWLFGEKGGER